MTAIDLYRNARFLLSAPDLRAAPADEGHEVAFAGRSNVGKSSALNALVSRRALARTSKTPGRTQHLVFFDLDGQRRLVDLPGYGYARVDARTRARWQHAIEEYLTRRRTLRGLMLIMDVRHPLTTHDEVMLEWCSHAGLAVHVLLTKADKLKRGAAKSALLEVRQRLAELPLSCTVQLFSALKHSGLEEAWDVLDDWLGVKPVADPRAQAVDQA